MPPMPKPQPCGQNWLAMSPTANGRCCRQCDKVIHDFSKLSWPEIERQQQAHGNALCGMYSPAQLTYWGQEPPVGQGACARLTAATTLALTLSALPASAQTGIAGPTTATKAVLRGTVYEKSDRSKPQPLYGVTVLLAGTQVGISTDEQGHYELAVPDSIDTRTHATIVFNYIGYITKAVALDSLSADHPVLVTLDAQLTPDTSIIAYSVAVPTRVQRLKWTLKRWLGRNE